ncbi:hypothetical protein KY289_008270 [Solanum tuberosum]|nr:hypothetical protein KY289_008270 [Solanum tuberosum]
MECDWYQNEVDEYGLTRVYFNKLCSKDDPFVLASQVYQVFYVADPIEKDVYYARNKVPVDLYDLEEENCPNVGDTFWGEPNDDIGSSTRLDEGDFRWSREDVAVDVVDIPGNAQHSEDTIVETSEEEDDVDKTDWDWMEADEYTRKISNPTLNKKTRGGTQMQNVHGRSDFLGTLARNGTFCPLNVFNWKMLKTHDDMWNYIKEKYDIPEVGKDWALGEIKLAWRGYKCRLKKMHFYA